MDQPGEMGKVLPRMELRLPAVRNAGTSNAGNGCYVACIEPKIRRERRFLFERRGVVLTARGVLESFDRRPVALNALVADDALHLVARRQTSVPDGLRVIAPEIADHVREAEVGHGGHVSRRRHRVDATGAAALEDGDTPSRTLEKVGRREPGDARADDYGVELETTVERRILRCMCC